MGVGAIAEVLNPPDFPRHHRMRALVVIPIIVAILFAILLVSACISESPGGGDEGGREGGEGQVQLATCFPIWPR